MINRAELEVLALKHCAASDTYDLRDTLEETPDDDLLKIIYQGILQDSLWSDNEIQFARLIAEICAVVEFTKANLKDLCDSMDLSIHDLNNLFERAQREWEVIKERNSPRPETYRVICLSTGHLSESDRQQLIKLGNDPDCSMIMGRDTGWFIKLYDEPECNTGYHGMSDEFHSILRESYLRGYRMVEFDCDATLYPSIYPCFD